MVLILLISNSFYTPYEFFPSALAYLSQESNLQQVSPGIQDSSQYSGQSQQYFSLDGLDLSADFQFFQSSFNTWKMFQIYQL